MNRTVAAKPDILHGKVLIVDDQPVNILLLERMLSGAGYVRHVLDEPGEVAGSTASITTT